MWIQHPRSKKPDTMLTLSVVAFVIVAVKFLFNEVTFEDFSFGTISPALIAALLTPTLGAYVGRKFKDSPDASEAE